MSKQEHTFIVTVGGCTAEQAEQVMRERICYDEEYGFDYDLGFSAERLTDQSVIDNPEAPERIEEWPEDDEHLRACRWVDSDECEWRHVGNGEWRFVTRSGHLSYPHPCPCDGPFIRVNGE